MKSIVERIDKHIEEAGLSSSSNITELIRPLLLLICLEQHVITRTACAEKLKSDEEHSFYFDNGCGETGMAIMKEDADKIIKSVEA